MQPNTIQMAVNRLIDSVWTILFRVDSVDSVTILSYSRDNEAGYMYEQSGMPVGNLKETDTRYVTGLSLPFGPNGEYVTYNVNNPRHIFDYNSNFSWETKNEETVYYSKLDKVRNWTELNFFMQNMVYPKMSNPSRRVTIYVSAHKVFNYMVSGLTSSAGIGGKFIQEQGESWVMEIFGENFDDRCKAEWVSKLRSISDKATDWAIEYWENNSAPNLTYEQYAGTLNQTEGAK